MCFFVTHCMLLEKNLRLLSFDQMKFVRWLTVEDDELCKFWSPKWAIWTVSRLNDLAIFCTQRKKNAMNIKRIEYVSLDLSRGLGENNFGLVYLKLANYNTLKITLCTYLSFWLWFMRCLKSSISRLENIFPCH